MEPRDCAERAVLPDGLPGLTDLPRTGVRPRTRRAVIAAAAVVALAAITPGVRWLGHRAPSVPRDQLWIATVQRARYYSGDAARRDRYDTTRFARMVSMLEGHLRQCRSHRFAKG